MRWALEGLRAAFHDRQSGAYRSVSSTVWVLIVVSVLLFMIEPLVPESHGARSWLRLADSLLLSVFALEYLLRVVTFVPAQLSVFRYRPLKRARIHAVGRLRFALQPMMLIDLVTILALVPELRGLRALRVLRLLRTTRVFRYGNPFTGLFHAFERDRLLFMFALSFLLVQVVVGGLSLYLIEQEENPAVASLGDAAWWALVTITTVGYGDITPVTALGRVVAGGLMVGGMFTLAVFAGVVGHSLLHAVLSVREEQFRMGNYVNHLVVCGYEDGMNMLLEALIEECDLEATRIVVFANLDRPPEIAPELYWVRGDPTKESELGKVRVAQAAALIVAGARHVSPQQADAVTLLTLFTVRSYLKKKASEERESPVYVVAEILDSENVGHARSAGADEVIETRRLGFSLLAHAIEHHGTADTMSQVVLRGDNTLFSGSIPEELQALTYGELVKALDLGKRRGLILGVTIEKTGREVVNPPEGMKLRPEMKVLYLARERLLDTS